MLEGDKHGLIGNFLVGEDIAAGPLSSFGRISNSGSA